MTVKTASRTPITDAIEARMAESGQRQPFDYPKSQEALEIERFLPKPYVLKTSRGRPAAIWRCDDLGEVMVAACVDRWPRDILKRLIEMHVAGVAEGQRVEKVRRRQAELARRAASADEDAPATPGMR